MNGSKPASNADPSQLNSLPQALNPRKKACKWTYYYQRNVTFKFLQNTAHVLF